jgi:hypothetical protein
MMVVHMVTRQLVYHILNEVVMAISGWSSGPLDVMAWLRGPSPYPWKNLAAAFTAALTGCDFRRAFQLAHDLAQDTASRVAHTIAPRAYSEKDSEEERESQGDDESVEEQAAAKTLGPSSKLWFTPSATTQRRGTSGTATPWQSSQPPPSTWPSMMLRGSPSP